jgi:ribosomal protein S21
MNFPSRDARKASRDFSLSRLQKPGSLAILSSMAIEARKKEGESGQSLLYTFTRKVKRSGIVKEVRHRKFHTRVVSRIKRRSSAIHREEKKADVERQKKLGLI